MRTIDDEHYLSKIGRSLEFSGISVNCAVVLGSVAGSCFASSRHVETGFPSLYRTISALVSLDHSRQWTRRTRIILHTAIHPRVPWIWPLAYLRWDGLRPGCGVQYPRMNILKTPQRTFRSRPFQAVILYCNVILGSPFGAVSLSHP